MKFTKKQFKRFSALAGAVSLSVAFGVGHLIASNEKIDSTPVITVPVLKTISPSDVYFEDDTFTRIDVDYTFQKGTTLGSFAYQGNVYLNFYNDNNHLFCLWSYQRNVYQSDTLKTSDYTVDLGLIGNWSSDFELNIFLSCMPPMIIAPNMFDDYRVNLDIRLDIGSSNYSYTFTDMYAYGSGVGISDGIITFVDDHISYSFMNFIYGDVLSSRQNGVDYVLSHLEDYNLYTQSQYLAYGNQQYQLGRGDSANVLSLGEFAREIFRAPISMFQNSFNFVLPLPDGTSLNVGGILTFFLTIGIALTIVNLIMKIGGH